MKRGESTTFPLNDEAFLSSVGAVICCGMLGQVWRTSVSTCTWRREQLYRYFPHLPPLWLKAPSVGSCPSDIIILGRISGLNQRAACTTCTVRGELYETDLRETPGDGHYSPAAYQAPNPRDASGGENGRARGRRGGRWQTAMIDDFWMDARSARFLSHIIMQFLFVIES